MTASDKTAETGGKARDQKDKAPKPAQPEREVGGQKGPEPTRYGDWEKNGIISDF